MTFIIIQNIIILPVAIVCLIAYLTSAVPSRIRAVSVVLFSAAAVGALGAAICSAAAGTLAAPVIILGETIVFIAILMLSFAAGRSDRTAVLRLCLSPLWAMILVLSSYAVSAINDGSAAVSVLGSFSVLIMAIPAACDFRRLYIRMKDDNMISEKRMIRKNMRRKKHSERKNTSAKRKKLKHGNKK